MMGRLTNLTAQFFISTHSKGILDAIEKNDTVFHFARKANAGTVVRPCISLIEKHRLLDDLGVTASSLLQVSCVIWVEGPSDRLYLREWLAAEDPALKEGSDYGFVYYGGKVLAGHAFENDDVNDYLELIKVSRYSAVVMDRDHAPSNVKVNDTKRRIIDGVTADHVHRLAVLTSGREIENDVSIELMRLGLAELTGHSYDGLVLTGELPYEDEAIAYLEVADDAGKKRLRRQMTKKADLARLIIADDSLRKAAVPPYIKNLAALIARSRHPDS